MISIGDRETPRVSCIDAPEIGPSAYGQQARLVLQGLHPVGSKVSVKAQTKAAMAGPSSGFDPEQSQCRATPLPIASTPRI